MNTTILKGTTIGDNVIIGAGSVVSKSIPNNCVAVGNPCRVIMTLGNMGSLLQSYALKTTIERLGHQVEFIDIEKREDDYKLLDDYKQKCIAEWT